MPRDANGNYTLPPENPVITGTVITSTWANGTMPDLGAEIQDSLSRSGYGGMLAALRILDEDGGVPGLVFRDETDSGLKRHAPGDVRIAAQGQDIYRTNPVTKGPEGWDDVAQEWVSLLPQGTPGNPTNPETTAENVTYDNTTSGLQAINVQEAIDEQQANPPDAETIDYDNTTSGLTATEVQNAIDELKGLLDALPPSYINPNNFMTGKISGSSGNTLKSSGLAFTSTRTGTGRYTITFSVPITATPYVLVAGLNTSEYKPSISIYEEQPGYFRAQVNDSNGGAPQDTDWSFILYFRLAQTLGLTVLNPSFETGDFTNWTQDFGLSSVVTTAGGFTAQDGTYFAKGDGGDSFDLYSAPINLTPYTSDIDAGKFQIAVVWQQAVWSPSDLGTAGVEWRDAGDNVIGTALKSMISDTSGLWVQRIYQGLAPPGTASVRIHLTGVQGASGDIDVGFDAVSSYYVVLP